jgi:hypothetical protein
MTAAATKALKAEMLAAFLAIPGPADQHVKDRRQAIGRPKVAASVRHRRAMTGATGIPETATPLPPAPVERVVDNPHVTEAIARDGVARGTLTAGVVYTTEKRTVVEKRKQVVTERVATRIGGLAFIRAFNPRTGKGKRREHHERTAERFLNLYEGRYGRVSPAVDPEREPVDTSPIAHDAGMAAALDATRLIEELEHNTIRNGFIQPPVFNASDFRFLVAVICLGISINHFTESQGRALDKNVDRFLALLDRLSEHWGLSMSEVA